MIRYHKAGPDKLLVSTRRNPRGYVVKGVEHRRVDKVLSRYEASVTWERISGWRPMSFYGKLGPVFWTKREAADYLISNPIYRDEVMP